VQKDAEDGAEMAAQSASGSSSTTFTTVAKILVKASKEMNKWRRFC
jgi:hypothetical protein